MKEGTSLHGNLKYVRSASVPFEEKSLQHVESLLEKGPISVHFVFEDYGERHVRSLSEVTHDEWDQALDWYHELFEGDLVQVVISTPFARPQFNFKSNDF